jgi:protein-S-isoprenylcysteine O-methyltransferase Ste14
MRAIWQHVAIVYVPLLAALAARAIQGRRPRRFAACLLSLLWVAPSLLAFQTLNGWAGWWTYSNSILPLGGIPLDAFVGWLLLWGLVPQIAFPRLPIALSAALMVSFDLLTMPLCSEIVHLGARWMIGEYCAAVFILLPALCIARWTESNTHLRMRATMQIAISGMVFLYLLPEIVFALRPGEGWDVLRLMPGWQRQLGLQLLLLLALPGVSAVFEFAERGHGTPIPYDPPQKLVTSGMYRYLANPMQTSCALVMLLWAGLLHNRWLVFAAGVSLTYSAGIAWWDEREDLVGRFGEPWRSYRREVRNWWPRWRPYHAGTPARLYIASTCDLCSELAKWITARQPVGLEIHAAEWLPAGSIRRMRYDPGDGHTSVEGIRALARALEHLHLGWGLTGAALRLPVVWRAIQILADASGAGPRTIPHLPDDTCARSVERTRKGDAATL